MFNSGGRSFVYPGKELLIAHASVFTGTVSVDRTTFFFILPVFYWRHIPPESPVVPTQPFPLTRL
jgi:hypothetical protein